MAKNKLIRWAAIEHMPNIIQPDVREIKETEHQNKGKWNQILFGNTHPIVLELGCGKGEYTVALAKVYPEKNFIGIDIKGSRLYVGAKEAIDSSMANVAFIRSYIEHICNIFAPGEISEIWITFPDPQPQTSRLLKRLTSSRFLNLYCNIMQDQGLVHLKTDNAELYHYTANLVHYNGIDPLAKTENLYESEFSGDTMGVKTYYENKYLQQGIPINYLRFKLTINKIFNETTE